MNNTMKNLKDEIEEMIMQYSKELLTIRDTHNVPWLLNECTKASNVFAEALTSLIEQEKERAVREFVNLCHKNEIYGDTGVVIGNFIGSNKSDLECLAEQYLAERKGE